MALSGSNVVNIGNQYLQLRVVWSAVQNIANNQSVITASLYLDLDGASLNVGSRNDSYITIDGLNIVFTAPAINVTSYHGSILLGTVTRTVTHNADGTKSLTVTGVWTARATLSGTYYATVSVTDTDTLNTIPRASEPTVSNSNPTLGDTITIQTHRASTAFTHTLKYTFGTQSGTIVTNLPTDYDWTLPLSMANGLPNAASGAGVITCETYEGSTLIGTKTVAFTATLPASIVPTIGSVNISEAIAGLAAQFLDYVQNKSKLNVVTTASGAYSSTISQIKVTIETKNYIGASITSDILTTSGTVAVTILVTDSRGRTATTTINVTVRAYSAPQIIGFSAYRVNGSGVTDDSGTSIAIPMNFDIASVNSKNTKAWVLEYRVLGATLWTALANGSVYTYNAIFTDLNGLFSGDNAYEIRLRLTDYFGTIERVISIGTAFALINYNPSGKGMAFGKVSQKDALEIALATEFSETPKVGTNNMWHGGNDGGGSGLDADLFDGLHLLGAGGVLDSGSNTNGNYIKFADGTMICWMAITVTNQAINNAYGSLFQGSRTWTFPVAFIARPTVICSEFQYDTGASWATVPGPSTTTSAQLRGIDAFTRAGGAECKISAMAIGRWKA